METRLRLLIVLAGLPEPKPGHTVRDAMGGWIGEVDLAYPADRIAIEYHGDVHRTKRGRWQSDIAKAELLRTLSWVVILITAEDVEGGPNAHCTGCSRRSSRRGTRRSRATFTRRGGLTCCRNGHVGSPNHHE